jgi:hypothetical protein
MNSGWGCQHLTTFKENKEWCRLLKHKCEPACKGCVLYGKFLFTQEHTFLEDSDEPRKKKNRSDNPLG